jgi:hypothetical protein
MENGDVVILEEGPPERLQRIDEEYKEKFLAILRHL